MDMSELHPLNLYPLTIRSSQFVLTQLCNVSDTGFLPDLFCSVYKCDTVDF